AKKSDGHGTYGAIWHRIRNHFRSQAYCWVKGPVFYHHPTTTMGTWCPTWRPPSPARGGESFFENSVLRRAAKARRAAGTASSTVPARGYARTQLSFSEPHNHRLIADIQDSDPTS